SGGGCRRRRSRWSGPPRASCPAARRRRRGDRRHRGRGRSASCRFCRCACTRATSPCPDRSARSAPGRCARWDLPASPRYRRAAGRCGRPTGSPPGRGCCGPSRRRCWRRPSPGPRPRWRRVPWRVGPRAPACRRRPPSRRRRSGAVRRRARGGPRASPGVDRRSEGRGRPSEERPSLALLRGAGRRPGRGPGRRGGRGAWDRTSGCVGSRRVWTHRDTKYSPDFSWEVHGGPEEEARSSTGGFEGVDEALEPAAPLPAVAGRRRGLARAAFPLHGDGKELPEPCGQTNLPDGHLEKAGQADQVGGDLLHRFLGEGAVEDEGDEGDRRGEGVGPQVLGADGESGAGSIFAAPSEAELEHLDAGAALEEEAEVGVDVEEGPRRVGADLVGPGGGSIAPERGVQTEVVAGTERPDGLGEATDALEPQIDGGNFAGAGGGEAGGEPVAFPIGAGTKGQIVERSRPDLEPEAGEIAGKEGALRPGGAQAEGGAELGGRSLEIQG